MPNPGYQDGRPLKSRFYRDFYERVFKLSMIRLFYSNWLLFEFDAILENLGKSMTRMLGSALVASNDAWKDLLNSEILFGVFLYFQQLSTA